MLHCHVHVHMLHEAVRAVYLAHAQLAAIPDVQMQLLSCEYAQP